MNTTPRKNVSPDIISSTPCDLDHACLSGAAACRVEPFVDRDVHLLWCRDERNCAYRKQYQGRFICNCPVNLAAYGLA